MTISEGSSFDRFTERARKCLVLAGRVAQERHRDDLSVEMLLLGILQQPESTGTRILQMLGVDTSRVGKEVERGLAQGKAPESGEISVSAPLQRVIEKSVLESNSFAQRIGTEHLLLGIMGAGNSEAADMLRMLGIKFDDLKAKTAEVLGVPIRNLVNEQADDVDMQSGHLLTVIRDQQREIVSLAKRVGMLEKELEGEREGRGAEG